MSQPRMTITVGRGGQRRATISTSSDAYFNEPGMAAGNRKRPLKYRLGDSSSNVSRQMDKRPRQEGGWRSLETSRDIDPLAANAQNGKQDLRYKLNQKNLLRSRQRDNLSFKDIPGRLSAPPIVSDPRAFESRRNLAPSMNLPSKAVPVFVPNLVAPRIDMIPRTHTLVEEKTVGSLLQSLGLGKYLITFQAEEIDMAALKQMSDDDLKELGIPMGPRKKIVMALASHR